MFCGCFSFWDGCLFPCAGRSSYEGKPGSFRKKRSPASLVERCSAHEEQNRVPTTREQLLGIRRPCRLPPVRLLDRVGGVQMACFATAARCTVAPEVLASCHDPFRRLAQAAGPKLILPPASPEVATMSAADVPEVPHAGVAAVDTADTSSAGETAGSAGAARASVGEETPGAFVGSPAPAAEAKEPQSTEQPAMSKTALKRLRKKEEWDAKKKVRKEHRKAKKEEKREKKREAIAQLIAEGKHLPLLSPRPAKVNEADVQPSDMKIIIDLSFDHLMTDREISSMTTQLSRSHSANKSSLRPVEITATGKGGKLGERLDTVFVDYRNWKRFHFDTRPYGEMFPNDKLVYLTADSPNVLTQLDESKAYIIGGFVDKNRHKNATLRKAEAEGITHAQLPIGRFIEMASRKVLAVNHVVEILIHYLQHRDWERAFYETIPQRKLGDNGKDED